MLLIHWRDAAQYICKVKVSLFVQDREAGCLDNTFNNPLIHSQIVKKKNAAANYIKSKYIHNQQDQK